MCGVGSEVCAQAGPTTTTTTAHTTTRRHQSHALAAITHSSHLRMHAAQARYHILAYSPDVRGGNPCTHTSTCPLPLMPHTHSIIVYFLVCRHATACPSRAQQRATWCLWRALMQLSAKLRRLCRKHWSRRCTSSGVCVYCVAQADLHAQGSTAAHMHKAGRAHDMGTHSAQDSTATHTKSTSPDHAATPC